jgi:hypothetical protein
MNDPGPIPKLRTPGVLAAALGEPLHRVLYVLRTRRHIRPTANAGRMRLYDRDALELLRHELKTIDARRAGGGTPHA